MKYLLLLLVLCLPAQAWDISNGTTLKNVRKLTVNGSVLSGSSLNGNALVSLDHNRLVNFSSNKHIDHTGVTLTAGSALTGGGDISASRTFDLATNGSLVVTNDKVQLNGDTASPGNSKYYGTNGSGIKGWNALTLGTVTSVNNADVLLSIANKTTTPTITMNGALVSWSTKARPSGTVVGTSDTQTLTNKTVEAGTINGVTTIDNIRAKTTAGTLFESLGGTDIANFGVANTANVAFLGGVSMKTATFNGNTMSLPTLSQGSILYSKIGGSLAALDNGASSNHKTLKINGNTLVWETAPSGSGSSTGTNTGDQTITLTGDVTGSGTGSFAATIASQTSANWATKISDEVGTGRLTFNGSTTLASPTLVTPAIGAATGTSLVTTGKIVAGTNVNGATANFNGTVLYYKTVVTDAEFDDGNSSTADTIDWGTGNQHKSTMTGNCTYTFTAPSGPTNLILKLVQDGTGSRTATWPATVKWPSATACVLSTAASSVDIVGCYYDGTNYYCQCNKGYG